MEKVERELGRLAASCLMILDRNPYVPDSFFAPDALAQKLVSLYLETPDVTIRVHPDRSDLVETRIIDGARYILIRAEEEVEVNGVPVQIT